MMDLISTIDELKHRAKEMRLTDLRRLISNLNVKRSEIEPHIHFTHERYARNLIYKCDNFECLVLCWQPGQRSPIHDHANSICTVYTVEGTLSADNYRKTANGHIRADYSEDFIPGSVLSIQTTEIHQVSNLQDSANLISLHFYLGPLENSFLYSVQQPMHELYQRTYTRVFTLADGI
ncbi:MAG TPA: cysteine dioxygenase family protein [Terriglobia bacterium]|nr:cysteine dioxygenase family protein [Terriglobia bacterium]